MTLEAEIKYSAAVEAPIDPDVVVEAVRLFRQHGDLMLRNCFDPDLIQLLQADFMQRYASQSPAEIERTCLEVGDRRHMFTVRLEPPFNDPALYAAPRVLPIVRALLGDDCIIQSLGAVCAYPGADLQHVHRDTPLLFPEAGGLNGMLPPHAVTVVVPLIDLDEFTGTTAMWEGSHRVRDTDDETTDIESDPLAGAVLPWPTMGDCYLMDYRLRHTGTPNVSDDPRPILYVVFSRGWYVENVNYTKQPRLTAGPGEYERIPGEFRSLFMSIQPDRSG